MGCCCSCYCCSCCGIDVPPAPEKLVKELPDAFSCRRYDVCYRFADEIFKDNRFHEKFSKVDEIRLVEVSFNYGNYVYCFEAEGDYQEKEEGAGSEVKKNHKSRIEIHTGCSSYSCICEAHSSSDCCGCGVSLVNQSYRNEEYENEKIRWELEHPHSVPTKRSRTEEYIAHMAEKEVEVKKEWEKEKEEREEREKKKKNEKKEEKEEGEKKE